MFKVNRIAAAVCLTCGLVAWASFGAVAQGTLDSALEYLKSYEFGAERAALEPIEAAVAEAGKDEAQLAALEKRFLEVLVGEATVEGKRILLRHVLYIGSAESVPVIINLATVEGLQDYVLRALVGIPGAASDEALVELSASDDAALRLGAVLALGRRGSDAASTALVEIAEGSQEDTALAAQQALVVLGNEVACDAFQRWLVDGNDVSDAVLDGALTCAQDALKAGDTETARTLYTALFETSRPGFIRAASLGGLVALAPEDGIDLVVKALSDSDPNLNRVAAGFIREIPGEEATAKFAGLLTDMAPASQALTLQALKDRGDASAAGAVAPLAKEGDSAVRTAAVEALGKLGDGSHVDVLLQLTEDEDRDVSAAAEGSLNTLNGPEVNGSLLAAAQSGEEAIRLASISALAERNAKETLPALLELVKSEEGRVATSAARASRVLADGKDTPALLALLGEVKSESVRAQVERAAMGAIERISPATARADDVLVAYADASDPALKEALIRILGEVGTENALSALMEAAESTERPIQIAAVMALSDWPNETPLDQIREWADQDDDKEIHGIAYDGYVRMLRSTKSYSPEALLVHYKHALEIAQSDNEKRSALAGISDLATLSALETAQSFMDTDLKAEATQAVIRIAGAVSGAFPAKARTLLEGISHATAEDAIKAQTNAALEVINGYGNFITAWELSGPYAIEGKNGMMLFKEAFAPETSSESADWHVAPMGVDKARPWLVELGKIFGGVERVAYLRTTIHAESAKTVVLEMGTNDGVKVWFNGENIHELNIGRPLNPEQDHLPLNLKEGDNSLLIAVFQHGGDWQAAAKLLPADGGTLDGVSVGLGGE